MQSLQCRQLLQHPSDPPQLCPDCPQGWCFSPQPCTYPRIYAARMNASSRKCLCKKTAFFLPFLGFFFPPPNLVLSRLLMGQAGPGAWCQQQGCARSSLLGEGRVGQPILATLCHVTFMGGWLWNLSWTCLDSHRWFIPSLTPLAVWPSWF